MTNYFVDATLGSDSNTGYPYDQAWKTIDKVNSYAFSTGDSVYFKCDETWTGTQLEIDWSGTSIDHVVIGAYYGSGTIVSTLTDLGGLGLTKPIFDGDLTAPSSYGEGLIDVFREDYVTVQDIKIINSAGHGLRFSSLYGQPVSTHGYAYRVDADTCLNSGITWNYSSYGIADSCVINLFAMKYYWSKNSYERNNSTSYSIGQFMWYRTSSTATSGLFECIDDGTTASSPPSFNTSLGSETVDGGVVWVYRGTYTDGWPGCLMASQNSDYWTCQNNTVKNGHGEGIGVYKHSNYATIQQNLVYNTEKLGIYIDGSHDPSILHNLVYGTVDTTYHRYTTPPMMGVGIQINDEHLVSDAAYNATIVGNFVAYCSAGIAIGSSTYGMTGAKIYNNTLVNNNASLWFTQVPVVTNSAIKNNVFWTKNGAPYGHIRLTSGNPSSVDWGYNFWSTSATDQYSGTGDVVAVSPEIYKTTGWDSITAGSLNLSDFGLTDGSPCINTGSNLGSTYDDALDVNNATLPDTVVFTDRDPLWCIGAAEYIEGVGVSSDVFRPTGWAYESGVQAGGTIDFTLENTTWNDPLTDANKQAIIDGSNGTLTTSLAWNTEIRDKAVPGDISRISDTVVRWTVPANNYDNPLSESAHETVNFTIPASVTAAAVEMSDSFLISGEIPVASGSGVLPGGDRQWLWSADGVAIFPVQ